MHSTTTDEQNHVAKARRQAALMLQAHARKMAGIAILKKRKARSTALVPSASLAQGGQKLHTTCDRLSSAIDGIVYNERRLPFLHASSDAAQRELMRVLNFSPGFTINVHVAEDVAPESMRRKLVAAMRDGVPFVLDLDPPPNWHYTGKPVYDTTALEPLCGPTHLPMELLCHCHPRAVYGEPAARAKLLGPLVGRARDDASDDLKTLGLDVGASEDEIKAAYRKLVKTAHPDRGGDPEAFRQVQTAFERLSGEGGLAPANATATTTKDKGKDDGEAETGDTFEVAIGFKR